MSDCNYLSIKGFSMHELSIATRIIDMAVQHARKQKAYRINEIHVNVGDFSGVEKDSLLFCFDEMCKGTIADNSKLNINSIAAVGLCLDCQIEFPMESLFSICVFCGGSKITLIRGMEMDIKYLKIEMDEE